MHERMLDQDNQPTFEQVKIQAVQALEAIAFLQLQAIAIGQSKKSSSTGSHTKHWRVDEDARKNQMRVGGRISNLH